MTVVVGAAAPEGIVLAADSRTTIQEGSHHRVQSDSARKVFALCGRYAVATYGAALLQGKTIHGIIDEFIAQRGAVQPDEIEDFAKALAAFFHDRVEGVLWRGQTDVIRRLIKGIDLDSLALAGVSLPDPPLSDAQKLEYRLLMPITLKDAVDFARFLVRTTIEMQRFSNGTFLAPGLVPGCGGPLQAVAVTRDGVAAMTPSGGEAPWSMG